jgi:transposase
VAEEETTSTSHRGTLHRNLDDTRRVADRTRRMEALSLKLAGLGYEQIAERMNMSVSGVKDMVNRTLERAENTAVEEMRSLENERLDRAQAAIWTQVLQGDLKAIDTFLRISTRRAKMNGLDAPTQINLSVDVRREMEEALSKLEDVVLGEVIHVHDDLADETG